MSDERRLTTRVLEKWKALARDGRLPRHADLVPEAFGADCPNCLLIEIAPDLPASRPVYIGKLLGGGGWASENPPPLSDHPDASLIHLATAKLGAMVARRAPITFGGTGVREATAVLYRAILLPLSDDGQRIDHAVGAINFKEISAVEEYSDAPKAPPIDAVSSFIAFSSRRVAFAPSAARRPQTESVR
jgi:hypothetical protein